MWVEFFLGILMTAVPADPDALRVCARPNNGFLTPGEGGQPKGFEYDLLYGFAGAQRLQLEIVWLEHFSDLLPAIERGECDLGAAGVMVTPARARRVAFSAPYFPVLVTLVEPGDRYTEAASALAGKKVAAVGGTVHEELLRELDGVQVVTVEGDDDLFASVVAGDAYALVCDSAIVLPFLAKYPGFHISLALTEPAHFAFPMPIGSPLKPALDGYLKRARSDGSYREALVRHFGEDGASFILEEER